MKAETLIPLLNFSRTLIQDGEFKFLYYENYPTPPNEVGLVQRKMLASQEAHLRSAHEKRDPEAFRKKVLRLIEAEKRYGGFRDSAEFFTFFEANTVFRVHHDSTDHKHKFEVWLELISTLENLPSVELKRFFGRGGQYLYLLNVNQHLQIRLPPIFEFSPFVGNVSNTDLEKSHRSLTYRTVNAAIMVPPTHFIDATQAQVDLAESDSMPVTIITHFPLEKVKAKIYVRIKKGLPEVFRQEYYYQSESPQADAEGYWLRTTTDYRDFETIKTLNLAFPMVRETKEFRDSDGFMRRHSVYTIKEADFNLGVSENFFDGDEADLADDDGRRKHIRGNTQKAKSEKNQQEATN